MSVSVVAMHICPQPEASLLVISSVEASHLGSLPFGEILSRPEASVEIALSLFMVCVS